MVKHLAGWKCQIKTKCNVSVNLFNGLARKCMTISVKSYLRKLSEYYILPVRINDSVLDKTERDYGIDFQSRKYSEQLNPLLLVY